MRSSGGDKEIRGRVKLKGTLEVPFQSSDRTPKLVLRNRGKGGKRGKKNFHRPRSRSRNESTEGRLQEGIKD